MEQTSTKTTLCGFCAEPIQLQAKKYKHCGEWLETKNATAKGVMLGMLIVFLIAAFVMVLVVQQNNKAAAIDREVASHNSQVASEGVRKSVEEINRLVP